jgi:bisphosphoglycerate-independent phosphoglycerate mutase (AlkP superfamily)
MNPVPFIKICDLCKIDQKSKWPKNPVLGLANVAPTILKNMRLDVPQQMTQPVDI